MIVRNALRSSPVERGERLAKRTPHDLQALYLDDVFRYVSAFVRPPTEAEDVTMEVFHAAFGSLPKLRRVDDPRLWLLGIARRKVADSLRKQYRRREEPFPKEDVAPPSSDIDSELVVDQVMRLLPDDQREALTLKYINGLTIEEVGAVLHRTPEAANSLIQRARQSFFSKGAPHFLPQEDEAR